MTSCTKEKTQNGIQTVQVKSRSHSRRTRRQAVKRVRGAKTPRGDSSSLPFTLKMSSGAQKRRHSPTATAATMYSVLVIFHHHMIILPAPRPS